jgi:hypothetical protein
MNVIRLQGTRILRRDVDRYIIEEWPPPEWKQPRRGYYVTRITPEGYHYRASRLIADRHEAATICTALSLGLEVEQ